MTNWHIELILDWMERVDDEIPDCDDTEQALRLFWQARYNNPMGQWREYSLRDYWHCAYPDDDLLGGSGSGYWNDTEDCATVERWIPPSWIPAEERP